MEWVFYYLLIGLPMAGIAMWVVQARWLKKQYIMIYVFPTFICYWFFWPFFIIACWWA